MGIAGGPCFGGFEKKEASAAAGEFYVLGNAKVLVDGGEKKFVVEVGEDVGAILQELLDHRVVAIDPFEDNGGVEGSQPVDDLFESESSGDDEVVQYGECEYELWL